MSVLSVVFCHDRNTAVFVVVVAKYKGVGRASVSASRSDVPVMEIMAIASGLSDAASNPLYAETALLHDSTASHRDIRVQLVA
jgi:hypothetical protein